MAFLRKIQKRLVEEYIREHELALAPQHLLFDWQLKPIVDSGFHEWQASSYVRAYLRWDNIRLLELIDRYECLPAPLLTHPVWKSDHLNKSDILNFRGDNSYVWQLRGRNMNQMSYALAAYYVKSVDYLALLDRLREDSAFGVYTFDLAGYTISRDLIDSILELYFLEKHLRLSELASPVLLDIGAGYGRLAYRTSCAFPQVNKYLCADAIAISTFVCEYYLRWREVNGRTKTILCDEAELDMRAQKVDIAINVHGFSECSVEAVDWWLTLLRDNSVQYLFVVPNANPASLGGQQLITKEGKDFGSVIRNKGYKLVVTEPKYSDPVVQAYGLSPTYYHLFELRA